MRSLVVALLILCPAYAALTPKQQADNLASFEQVWSTARDHHPDTTMNGLDWNKVHAETRPLVEKAASMDEVRDVLSSMLGKLGTSHYGIVPGDVYKEFDETKSDGRGTPGLHTVVVGDKAVVSSVDPGSAAERAGIKPGMIVDGVNGTDIAPMLQSIASLKDRESELIMQRSVARKLSGPVGEPVNVRVLDAAGKPIEARLDRESPKGELVSFANLPPVRLIFESKRLESGAGYIAFNFFLNPVTLMPQIEKAVNDFAKAPGIIIDLRGNPGGIGFMASGIAGFFTDKSGLQLGEMKTHELTLKFVIFPRAETYPGKLAILVDGGSASTSEIFAEGMQDLKRARVFGTRTAGAALPSNFERLPNGDGFQYAMATYKSEGGKVLEGNGVTPDVEVHQTQAALASGDDLVIRAAEQWIRSRE